MWLYAANGHRSIHLSWNPLICKDKLSVEKVPCCTYKVACYFDKPKELAKKVM